jgi:glycosyltransferase involved in cell wall biosynthesis
MNADATAGTAMMVRVRVAFTMEHCWHEVPGGTATAINRLATAMENHDDIRLIGVAGRHRHLPPDPYTPPIPIAHLPLARPWLYETWLRWGWPKVERATGRVDVAHATTIIPCPSDAPLMVTIHDLAFLHDPTQFTGHGVRVFNDSLDVVRRRADMVLCCSQTTMDDCLTVGIGADRLRLVPWGVDSEPALPADIDRVRSKYSLPDQFVLFVGTLEPRKNLRRLAAAMTMLDTPLPLVVCGPHGWGDDRPIDNGCTRFLGFIPAEDLAPLYAAATVFCYPSEREGFGLPVLEAMAQGTPVVTSGGTATEETAGSAAVLVDPRRVDDIARGITEALGRTAELSERGLARVRRRTWARAAELTAAAYREFRR